MKTTLGVGVIGCGDVVEKKSGPSINLAPRSRLVSIMRRNTAELERVAAALNPDNTTTDAAAVLEDPKVDVVYVATTPNLHRQYVEQAAKAGKHVLVEKPMGLTAADSLAMVDACAAAGVELFVAYYRRFWPHVLEMKRLIDAGELGTLQHAFFDLATPWKFCPHGWRLDPDVNGGGFFVDVGSHRLDLLVYLLGGVQHVSGVVQPWKENPKIEEALSLCLQFENGVQGLVRSDFCTERLCDCFQIVGTKAQVLSKPLDGHGFSFIPHQAPDQGKPFSYEKLPAPHLGLIQHIEEVLLDGKPNQSSGRDGMRTSRILDDLLQRSGAVCD